MSLKEFLTLMWFTAFEVLNIPIEMFEYSFTILQLIIFGFLFTTVLVFLIAFGRKD